MIFMKSTTNPSIVMVPVGLHAPRVFESFKSVEQIIERILKSSTPPRGLDLAVLRRAAPALLSKRGRLEKVRMDALQIVLE